MMQSTSPRMSAQGGAYHNIASINANEFLSPETSASAAIANSSTSRHYTSPFGSPHQSPVPEIKDLDFSLNQKGTSPCLWDSCSIPLDDLSPGGLWRHLRDMHGLHDRHARISCRWGLDGGCGLEMNCASLGNHISTVHLKTAGRVCQICHEPFTRGDALARHIKKNSCRSGRR